MKSLKKALLDYSLLIGPFLLITLALSTLFTKSLLKDILENDVLVMKYITIFESLSYIFIIYTILGFYKQMNILKQRHSINIFFNILYKVSIDFAFITGMGLLLLRSFTELSIQNFAQHAFSYDIYFGPYTYLMSFIGKILFIYTFFGFIYGMYRVSVGFTNTTANYTPLSEKLRPEARKAANYSIILFIASLYINFNLAGVVGIYLNSSYQPTNAGEDWGGIILMVLSLIIGFPLLTIITSILIWIYRKSQNSIIIILLVIYFIAVFIGVRLPFMHPKISTSQQNSTVPILTPPALKR